MALSANVSQIWSNRDTEIEDLRQKSAMKDGLLQGRLEQLSAIDAQLAAKDEELKKANLMIGELTAELNSVLKNAEIFEFILHIRAKLREFEHTLGVGFPIISSSYERLIKDKYPPCDADVQSLVPQELRKGLVFRKWIYILHFVNSNACQQLELLRQALYFNRDQYFHFAVQVDRLHKVFSNDMCIGPSSIGLKYIDLNRTSEYLQFFNTELKICLQIFLNTL